MALLVCLGKPGMALPEPVNECTVRLLVVYSAEAAAGAGSSAILFDNIYVAVGNINYSFQNSNIDHSVELAGIRSLGNYPTSCYSTALSELKSTNDGKIDFVHAWRDAYRADVVVMVVKDSTSCGISDNTPDAASAFIVVNYECLLSNYSLARELGYLYQAGNHESLYVPEGILMRGNQYANNKGFIYDSDEYVDLATQGTSGTSSPQTFSTIMAYTDEEYFTTQTGFDMIPYWSTPGVTYHGKPVGDATHNNAAVIKYMAPTLAGYRVNRDNETVSSVTVNNNEVVSYIANTSVTLGTASTINSGSTLLVKAGESVVLQPGVLFLAGSSVKITTDPGLLTCSLPAAPAPPGARLASTNEVYTDGGVLFPTQDKEPDAFSDKLITAYPNPFEESINLEYTIPADGVIVNCELFDGSGRRVGNPLPQTRALKGTYTLTVSTREWGPGIYLYVFRMGGKVETGRLVKIR